MHSFFRKNKGFENLCVLLLVTLLTSSLKAYTLKQAEYSVEGVKLFESFDSLRGQFGVPTFWDYDGGPQFRDSPLVCEYQHNKWRRVDFGTGETVKKVSGRSLERNGHIILKIDSKPNNVDALFKGMSIQRYGQVILIVPDSQTEIQIHLDPTGRIRNLSLAATRPLVSSK